MPRRPFSAWRRDDDRDPPVSHGGCARSFGPRLTPHAERAVRLTRFAALRIALDKPEGQGEHMISGRAYARARRYSGVMYLDLFKLIGRVALVTGGGRGIGLACAEALAEAGAQVIIGDCDATLADEGRATLRAKGRDADVVIMDVTDSGRVTEVAGGGVSRHGRV